MATNFDLAPPPKTVDGLQAVPIDIQKITASLTFDGATSSAQGDATLEFIMGPQNGNPVFDLRQTITAAWLDGVSVPVAQLAHHDFGGGPNAELRIVESVLASGSTHTLRVSYTLGTPQASMAGSYLPAMTWSTGPRLAFNFGFTDLGAGRYLEAWIPANLIFDQFEVDLELQVLNTPIPHTVITNGAVTSLGANHWSVSSPTRFTALSTLLELRASDTLTSMTDTTTLPVSGTVVTIEAWKLTTNPVSLATEISNLKTWLANNENSYGPYLHGNRFVAFLNVGGMEYEGGTTSSSSALRHETFHSWFARGLKPASQPDGWWDEAWTVYNDLGAGGSLPFDFTDPSVELHPENPWVRITAGGAYTDGERFFEGVASLIGVANLKSLMSDFYKERNATPVTTMNIEEFLVCRSGQPQLVDAFHRFVYGFTDPSPAPDLWIQDDSGDTGSTPWGGRFWDSPDLWIRNTDDGGMTHQPVEHGQDNWFYARVRNRSVSATARHYLVTFNVKPFAGIEFQYPADFLPCIAAAAGFELGPGASTIVKARWPAALVPPVGTHACWLAAVFTRLDAPMPGRHVWEHNNLAQKNLTVVNLVPDEWLVIPFVINRFAGRLTRPVSLELVQQNAQQALEAALLHRSGTAFKLGAGSSGDLTVAPTPRPSEETVLLDCGGVNVTTVYSDEMWTSRTPNAFAARQFDQAMEVAFDLGGVSQVPIALRGSQQLMLGLRLHVPANAKPGTVFKMDLIQRDKNGKHILGGLAIEIHVR
jgi:hypothetical protein